jgi:hypothetical protein
MAPSLKTTVAPSDTLSNFPSSAPTLTCNVSPEERELLIKGRLNAVSDSDDLDTAGTPQNLARTWLIEDDPAYTCPEDKMLVQRYTMAVFYYSTEGDDWAACSAPTNFTDQAAIDEANANCPGTPWLTEGLDCEWAGLSCNDKNEMERIDIGEYSEI